MPRPARLRTSSTLNGPECDFVMAERTFCLATFPSELGWMAVVGRGKSLSQLVFGYASPQQAVAALDAHISPQAWAPAWITKLQAFARGDAVDLRSIPLELGPLTPF